MTTMDEETVQLPGGSVDLLEDGTFHELRVSGGVRLRRLGPGRLVLDTEGGARFVLDAPVAIEVRMERGAE
jgi:hypothetical protein